jgi:hypothetical protein
MSELPLSIRDKAPHPLAFRLTGVTANGLPSGFHTGGAWLWDGEVYKPLDGRPYANCEHHYPTQEDTCLLSLQDQPLFPMNWRIEEANGRRFLVRKKAMLIPEVIGYDHFTWKKLLYIEAAIRNMNRLGWEVGDHLALAYDEASRLFIYDLSCAHPQTGVGCYQADDDWRLRAYFANFPLGLRLNLLRENARHILNEQILEPAPRWRHAYASFNRPIDRLWATLPEACKLVQQQASWESWQPHTWLICKEPLDQDTIDRYELTWGWSPIV